jgi:hypothetical protein
MKAAWIEIRAGTLGGPSSELGDVESPDFLTTGKKAS